MGSQKKHQLSQSTIESLGKIKLLLMDCDGVLTDGRLYFSAAGEELKVFDVRDGQGIVAWHAAGFRSGIVSGRDSGIVETRAAELGIRYVRQGVKDKLAVVREIALEAGVVLDEIAFIGDDIPDIEAITSVGLGAAPRNAAAAVRSAAVYACRRKGGRGAVRELIDMLLAHRNI